MTEFNIIRKSLKEVVKINERAGVPYLTFSSIGAQQGYVHGFSTRLGGVSLGDCASMNLSFSRGDDETAVRENYCRIARAIGFDENCVVCSDQTHTTNVREVT